MATSVKDWKAASAAAELPLPSGNVALVRNPGMQVFLKSGLIPNSLLAMVMESIEKDKMPELDTLAGDPQKLRDVMDLIDSIAIYCVVEPKIEKEPAEGEVRDDELLYVSEVDMNDKLFIFQYAVGGTKDLEQFRESTEAALDGVRGGKGVAGPTKRSGGPAARRR